MGHLIYVDLTTSVIEYGTVNYTLASEIHGHSGKCVIWIIEKHNLSKSYEDLKKIARTYPDAIFYSDNCSSAIPFGKKFENGSRILENGKSGKKFWKRYL